MFKVSYVTSTGKKYNEKAEDLKELQEVIVDWLKDENASVIHIHKK